MGVELWFGGEVEVGALVWTFTKYFGAFMMVSRDACNWGVWMKWRKCERMIEGYFGPVLLS